MKTSTLSLVAPRARRPGSARAALLATYVLPCLLRSRRDEHRDLALRARGSIPSGEVRRRPACDLLVDLRELACDRDTRLRIHGGEVGEEIRDPVRALVKDDRPALGEEVLDLATARAALLLRESDERELARRQPGRDERGDRGRGP